MFQLIFPQGIGIKVMYLNAVIGGKHGKLAGSIFQCLEFQLLPVKSGQRHVRIAAGGFLQQAGSQLFHLHQIGTVNIVKILQFALSNLGGKLFRFTNRHGLPPFSVIQYFP